MARALARGWGQPVVCCDAGSGRARELALELGGEAVASPAEVAGRAEVLVLVHKPAGLPAVAAALAGCERTVVSALGGVSLATLKESFPAAPVFRVMPNVPAEVGRGVTCVAAAPEGDPALWEQVRDLFARLGTVQPLDERLMDVATAVAGVGPAYASLLVEAQVEAAVRQGLEPRLAGQMVAETMGGTAALLEARGYDTLTVRREVTSPGGITARGLAALEQGGVRAAFQNAIDAALGRSRP